MNTAVELDQRPNLLDRTLSKISSFWSPESTAKSLKNSIELTSLRKHFAEEQKAQGGITALGRISTRVQKKDKDTLLFFGGSANTLLQLLAFDTISKFIAQNFVTAINFVKTALPIASQIPNLKHDFIDVNADVAQAIKEQISYEKLAVEKIADGTFIGPHPEKMHKLIHEFENAGLEKEDFKEKALGLRGIVFSEENNCHSLCRSKLNEIRSQFNIAGDTMSDNELKSKILVHWNAVQPYLQEKTANLTPAVSYKYPEPEIA